MAFFNVKNFEIKKKNSTHTHKERISVVGTQPRECSISEIKSRREREINSVQGFK